MDSDQSKNSADQAKSIEPTDTVRKALDFANGVALDMGHEYVGTEHILLGLLKCSGGCCAVRMLQRLNVNLQKISDDVGRLAPCGQHVVMGKVPLTARAKDAKKRMEDLGSQLGSKAICTGHLLAALFFDEGTAGTVLMNQGVNAENLNQALMAVLGEFDYVAEETLSDTQEVGPGSASAFFVGVELQVPDTAEFDSFVANAKRDIESASPEARAQVWATLALATVLNDFVRSAKQICEMSESEMRKLSQEQELKE